MSTFIDDSVDIRLILNSDPKWQKNRLFLINSKRQKSTQKVEKFPKITKFRKFLNHVFKTSKKTLSYSRTYCKIYKIENIGKIGQSSVGLMAKRVIYYGSTRSTLSTPLSSKYPPHFHRWISKSGKKWNYHFWGFLSQKCQNRHFWHFWSISYVKNPCCVIHHLKFCQKVLFSDISSNFTAFCQCLLAASPHPKHV